MHSGPPPGDQREHEWQTNESKGDENLYQLSIHERKGSTVAEVQGLLR